jgi:hypothetical protein
MTPRIRTGADSARGLDAGHLPLCIDARIDERRSRIPLFFQEGAGRLDDDGSMPQDWALVQFHYPPSH